MRIRPGTIVTVLCFALMIYAVVAILAVQRVMGITCPLRGGPPTPVLPGGSAGPIAGIAISGVAGILAQAIAGIYVRRHRHNHNQCVKCGWPRTIDRPICPQCGRRHTTPMLLESRFEVMRVTDRPRLSLR